MAKLFLYYALHSFKNQIKKLFRSWVIILIAACIFFGTLIGVGASLLSKKLEEGSAQEDEISTPVDENIEEDDFELSEDQVKALVGLIASGIILTMIFFSLITADKDGSKIFLMADVNLLFPAPMKPQSVLLFRLMAQILVSVFASIYLLFQTPNLVVNLGMPPVVAVSLLFAWAGFLIFGKLINVLAYTLTSTHVSLKKYIRPTCYATFLLLGGSFLFYFKSGEKNLFDAADAFFNAKWSFWLPIYGWLKGLIYWSWTGNRLNLALSFVLIVAGVAGLSYLVWNIKADFYEDALAKAQEVADAIAAVQAGGTVKRKKDRSEKIVRDGMKKGAGASVFFWKSVYNRFRFSLGRVLTKTSGTYLTLSLLLCAVLIFGVKERIFPVVGFGICGLVFFRSLGNPLAKDVEMPYFTTIPENPWKKVIYSILGGSLDCFLDVLPALLLSGVLLQATPLSMISFVFLALSIDFYAENVMLFIELSTPTSLSLQVKQMISILFIYFGLLPIVAVLVLFGLFVSLSLGVAVASLAALLLGGIFYGFSPLFLQYGRK